MSTDKEILAAVDALPVRRKARLMPLLRRRLEDYYDLQAVKRAQKSGVYHAYEQVRRELPGRRERTTGSGRVFGGSQSTVRQIRATSGCGC